MTGDSEMGLMQKQQRFTKLLSMLIDYAYSRGYALSVSFSYREPGPHPRYEGDQHPMMNDCHVMRLAQDFNLFVDGEWIPGAHDAWNDLGEYWKKLDPLARWGGDFSFKDFGHFSLTHLGLS